MVYNTELLLKGVEGVFRGSEKCILVDPGYGFAMDNEESKNTDGGRGGGGGGSATPRPSPWIRHCKALQKEPLLSDHLGLEFFGGRLREVRLYFDSIAVVSFLSLFHCLTEKKSLK